MIKLQGVYRTACLFIGLSVLLHFLSPLVGGVNEETIALLTAGVLWLAVLLGLRREWRWVAYIAFMYSLVGSIAALSGYLGPSDVPPWLFALIVIVDVLAGVVLFRALWRNKIHD